MSRTYHRVLLTFCTVLLGSCTYKNLGDYCKFSQSPSIIDADSGSLGVILGAPPDLIGDSPTVMIYRPSEADREALIRLELIEAPIAWPGELDETPCGKLDWRTYRVVTDADQWKAFWSRLGPARFEFHLQFPDSDFRKRLRIAQLAIAVVDTTSGEIFKSCGCYWT